MAYEIDPNITGIEGLEDAKEARAELRARVTMNCRRIVPDLIERIEDGDCVARRPGESDESLRMRINARINEAGRAS